MAYDNAYHSVSLEQFFQEVFNEANKQHKKQILDTPKSKFFKTVYQEVKKYTVTKSKNNKLPDLDYSETYYKKVLKPGVKTKLGDVAMSDGVMYGGNDTFKKLGIRKRERFLQCIKDTLENPGFIYYEKAKNEKSPVLEDRCPTEIFVNLYHTVNNKNQNLNVWVAAVVRVYSDKKKVLVSIYPYENEDELLNKVLASDKIFNVEKGAWVNGPVENKATDSGYSPSEPITAQSPFPNQNN